MKEMKRICKQISMTDFDFGTAIEQRVTGPSLMKTNRILVGCPQNGVAESTPRLGTWKSSNKTATYIGDSEDRKRSRINDLITGHGVVLSPRSKQRTNTFDLKSMEQQTSVRPTFESNVQLQFLGNDTTSTQKLIEVVSEEAVTLKSPRVIYSSKMVPDFVLPESTIVHAAQD